MYFTCVLLLGELLRHYTLRFYMEVVYLILFEQAVEELCLYAQLKRTNLIWISIVCMIWMFGLPRPYFNIKLYLLL